MNFLYTQRASRSILALSIFRIGLGIFMLLHFFPLIKRVSNYHITDNVLYFPHRGFEWLSMLDKPIMLLLVGTGILLTICFTIGFKMRWTGITASILYLYFILLDKFYYNNHYYLLALMLFLCSLTVADRSLSIRKDRLSTKTLVTIDHYFILRLMLCIVFFYGGLAKLNQFWVSGDISSEILSETVFGNGAVMVLLLSWGGLLFDLGISFLLMIRRTRWIAFVLALFFNVTNAIIFSDISYFPYFMLFSMVLFFPGMNFYDQRTKAKPKENVLTLKERTLHGSLGIVIIVFFVFQLLFPLRHHLITGFADWTGQGHYFSWRMKSFTKVVELQFYLVDKSNPVSKQKLNIGLDNYTLQRAAVMPDMVLHLADYVASNLKRQGDRNFAILCDYDVNLDSQGSIKAIDPTQDLLASEYNMFSKNNWILDWELSK